MAKVNRSPFGIFMHKIEFEENRRQSMPELVSHCTALWNGMTAEQRVPYNELSATIRHAYGNTVDKQSLRRELQKNGLLSQSVPKTRASATTSASAQSGRRTANDRYFNAEADVKPNMIEIEANYLKHEPKEESDESDDDMYEFVEDDECDKLTALLAKMGDVRAKTIVVMAFNVVVHTQEGQYVPNEVGLIEFSIEKGVASKYEQLIAAPVPTGYYASAKQHSEMTHKIPLNSDNLGHKDYPTIVESIYNFMNKSDFKAKMSEYSNEKVLVFCAPPNKVDVKASPQVVGSLKWLRKEAMKMKSRADSDWQRFAGIDFGQFYIIDLSLLLYALSAPYEQFRPRNLFMDDLRKCTYDYAMGTRCDYHESIENLHCASGAVTRLAYLFLEPACRYLSVTPTGKHYPIDDEAYESQISEVKFREIRKSKFQDFAEQPKRTEPRSAAAVINRDFRAPNNPNVFIGIGRAKNNPRY